MDFTKAIRETGKETAASAFPQQFSNALKDLQRQRAEAKKEGRTADVEALDTKITELVSNSMKNTLTTFTDGVKKSGDAIGTGVGKAIDMAIKPTLNLFGAGNFGGSLGAPEPTVARPISAPSNQINPEWIYGVSKKVEAVATQTQTTQQQVKIDASDIPSLPKRIDVYFNKPASVDFSTIEEALSSGVLKIEEATFNAVEKTAKRLGKQSRLP